MEHVCVKAVKLSTVMVYLGVLQFIKLIAIYMYYI